jgi:hypothetical protein
MLKSKKHVFWEAFLLTILIFVLGIFLGIGFEKRNINIIEDYYSKSEISMIDMFVLQNLINSEDYPCKNLIQTTIKFADKIYEEAQLLETYEKSNILTDKIILSHKKYDLLRTFIWINSLTISKKCSKDFIQIVYLYEYNPENIETKATQAVWSNILKEVKQKYGNKIILIPIAINNNLSSIDTIISKFEIKKFPVVIIKENIILNELKSSTDIEKLIDNYSTEYKS